MKKHLKKYNDNSDNILKRRDNRERHLGGKKTLSQLSSFLKTKKKTLKEEAEIRSYSPQALGRKRNMFLHATALDGDAFAAFVRDRLYRIAYDNQRSVADFTPRDIEMGLNRWEEVLRQGDKQFGKYLDQFRMYAHRFMDVAKALVQQGEPSLGDKPSEAGPPSVEGAPSTPKLLRYKSQQEGGARKGEVLPFGVSQSDLEGGRKAPAQQAPEGEPQVDENGQPIPAQPGMEEDPSMMMQFTPEDEQFLSYVENMSQALELNDDDFMLHVEDTLLNSGVDPFTVSQEELDVTLDEDFESLMASLPLESLVRNNKSGEFEKIFAKYKERFMQFAENTLEKVKVEELEGPKEFLPIVTYKPTELESSLVYGFISKVNTKQPISTTNISLANMNKVKKDPGLMASGQQFASNLAQMYPMLSKAYAYVFGGNVEESQIHEDWPLYSATSNTNIIFEFPSTKVILSRGKIKNCSENTLNRKCTTKLKCSLFVDEVEFPLGSKQEIKQQLNDSVISLKTSDYIFDTPYDIQKRFMMHGEDESMSKSKADMVFTHKQAILDAFVTAFSMSPTGVLTESIIQNIIQKQRSEAKRFTTSYFNEFKDIISEFLCKNIKGEGKFKQTSDAESNTMIVGNSFGSKVMLIPMEESVFFQLAQSMNSTLSIKDDKLQKQNYLKRQLLKQDPENEEKAETLSQKERPFTINDLYQRIRREIDNINAIIATTPISPNMTIMNLFTEDLQGYIESAMKYASYSFGNFIKFFDIELDGIKFEPINIYTTLTGEIINKEEGEEDV